MANRVKNSELKPTHPPTQNHTQGYARSNRTTPLPPFISDPYFASIACATCEMIGRVSALLYRMLLNVAPAPVVVVRTPSPGGAAVLSTIRSSLAISQVASTRTFGTTSKSTKFPPRSLSTIATLKQIGRAHV